MEWTLCAERMPDKIQLCLTLCRELDTKNGKCDRNISFRLMEYHPYFKIWRSSSSETFLQVIAWMPVPEIPGFLRSRYYIDAV